MGPEESQSIPKEKRPANFRLYKVSGNETELVEIRARNPTLNVLFIPGNPGVVTFYTDFLESLYEQLEGTANVTGIGHISHSKKDWEARKLFTLREQIDHKVFFIQQELQNNEVPLILVGHSIGAYMSLEVFKRIPEKVAYLFALYPFLAADEASRQQSLIKKLAGSQFSSRAVSAAAAFLGFLPSWASRFIAKNSMGKSWSATAVNALCSSVLQYHTMRNVLYLAKTEFEELVTVPDWAFMRDKRSKMAYLFGVNDHWAPLHMLDELVRQVPDAVVEVETEGHTHAFCCTMAGSVWVARYIATIIKNNQI